MANPADMANPQRALPVRALIVIDVQNDYDGGNLTIEYPVFSDSVQKVAAAMDAARRHGVKIVVVKMISPPTAKVFAAGTPGAEFHPEIAAGPFDHYIEKTLPSAFTGTDLELWLRGNGIDTVTIAGYMTHNCDLSTVIHAFHMGFDVEFLSDATGSVPYANSAGEASARDIHHVMTVVFQSRFAAVLTTDAWTSCLETGALPERDDIPSSNRRALALRQEKVPA